MIKNLFICATFLVTISCVSSSGVLPFGPDTYTLTVESTYKGMSAATKEAITEATKYCQSEGKYFFPKNTNQKSTVTSFGDPMDTYSLIFRCLFESDPEYQRSNWGKSPDTVIEDRRQ